MGGITLGPDFTEYMAELLKPSSFGLDATIKEISQAVNSSLNATELFKQSIQLNCSELNDAVRKALSSSLPLWSESMRESLTGQLSNASYLEAIRNIALSTLDNLDIEEPEKCSEIPAEKVQPALNEVERYLPEDATEVINAKIAKSKTSDNKISLSDWVAIVGVIVSILLFLAEQTLSSEHDKKEEAYWAATDKYQQESLELQRQDIALKQEILDCFKDLQGDSFRLDDVSDGICDLVDSQTDNQDREAVQDGQQKKSETEE